ncbi:uncharacterized protein M421DRAFT_421610 [Didymella exigua CBS 183.55]|uniref:C2H2-type domain-containing protein n=1 Tax=Didymella exigua CBS 183.55 TaxID=1150837 RepID=A0A6A5RKH0_9PLEO|nr:uncharacterized protein M421DRAFT_421610 [Didymella exigua CBS 183.55]KAF1927770.1 hypothetical protein M421DRAFT_421610 [Didymella exigua CBS 183.55]
MTIRSPDGAFTSVSLFDSPPEADFYISNITEWRKDIPTPVGSGQDLSFSSDFQDMQTELFDFKDTASQCSMDSTYQSQTSASRRGTKRQQPFSQDSQSTMGTHFAGSDIYSPSMSSDSHNAFMDMNQMQLPAAWDAQNGSGGFANYTTGQDFSLYQSSNVARLNPTSAVNVWGPVDSQYQNAYNFSSYPTDSIETMFSTAAPVQHQWGNVRPTPVRAPSSYTVHQASRRTSSNDAGFNAFVGSPTSTASVQLPQAVDLEQAHYIEQRNGTEESNSTSLAPQSLNGHEDVQSPTDAIEAKLEEERTKVARSHALYQQGPDKDGKYHCPEEGRPGCTHKPTPLKCNYDKYVDSHLKPFRCNKKTCVGVQFSSTACLLRHEREAHGMHGHGARPHLCHFQDCERAVPGHGFPRRYNLFDHMKRVHQFEGPTTEPSPPLQGQAPRKPVSRKRKASAEDMPEKRPKVIKLTAEQQLQQRRDQLAQDFASKKQHIIDFLTNLTGPNELSDDLKLSQDVMALHDISTKFKHGG